MSNNSLTRLELSDAVVREVGLSRHESMQLVDDVLDHVSNALTDGENVKLSSFGTFSCNQKKIPLSELKYWNVELQEAYFSPIEVRIRVNQKKNF